MAVHSCRSFACDVKVWPKADIKTERLTQGAQVSVPFSRSPPPAKSGYAWLARTILQTAGQHQGPHILLWGRYTKDRDASFVSVDGPDPTSEAIDCQPTTINPPQRASRNQKPCQLAP